MICTTQSYVSTFAGKSKRGVSNVQGMALIMYAVNLAVTARFMYYILWGGFDLKMYTTIVA